MLFADQDARITGSVSVALLLRQLVITRLGGSWPQLRLGFGVMLELRLRL